MIFKQLSKNSVVYVHDCITGRRNEKCHGQDPQSTRKNKRKIILSPHLIAATRIIKFGKVANHDITFYQTEEDSM